MISVLYAPGRHAYQYKSIFFVLNEYQKGNAIIYEPFGHGSRSRAYGGKMSLRSGSLPFRFRADTFGVDLEVCV